MNPFDPFFSTLAQPMLPLDAFETKLQEWVSLADDSLKAGLTDLLDCIFQASLVHKHQNVEAAAEKQQLLVSALKQLLGTWGSGHLALAQIASTPGAILENAKKILAYARLAESLEMDGVIFPELALMGYPVYDGIGRFQDLVDQNLSVLEALARRSGKTRLLVGFVEPRDAGSDNESGKSFYNSLAVLGEGKVLGIVRKSLLPNYDEFEDVRMFKPSLTPGVQKAAAGQLSGGPAFGEASPQLAEIHQNQYGIVICEDGWNDPDFFGSQALYSRDPVNALASLSPDVMINVSASPTRTLKEQLRHAMLGFSAAKYKTPLVYVNRTGAVDELIFDGTSRMYDAEGKLIARGKPFEEQFLIVNPLKGFGTIYPLPEGEEKTFHAAKKFHPKDTADLERTYLAVKTGVRSYFKNAGCSRAILGLSGGLDSSVCATLLADALGAENVLGVSMPSVITTVESKTHAKMLAENLGIRFLEIPIEKQVAAFQESYRQIEASLQKQWGQTLPPGLDVSEQNIQAMVRATHLRYLANKLPGVLPIATSDKSELYIGYATVNGDMSGALAPIGDITKMKLFALADWLNEHRENKNAIPSEILEKPPGAELALNPDTGKPMTAEEDYGPYEFRDEIIWRLENLGQTFEQMLAEPFWYEVNVRPLLKEEKQAWLNRFFTRMGFAFFKWYIMPTTLNIDAKSITKSSFRIPIAAGSSHWKPLSESDIEAALNAVSPSFTVS